MASIYYPQFRSNILCCHCICSLFPSLMREGSYSTIRLGAYEPLKVYFGATDPAHTPLWKKICAGAISGQSGSRTERRITIVLKWNKLSGHSTIVDINVCVFKMISNSMKVFWTCHLKNGSPVSAREYMYIVHVFGNYMERSQITQIL